MVRQAIRRSIEQTPDSSTAAFGCDFKRPTQHFIGKPFSRKKAFELEMPGNIFTKDRPIVIQRATNGPLLVIKDIILDVLYEFWPQSCLCLFPGAY
jgi:hypothetical protein